MYDASYYIILLLVSIFILLIIIYVVTSVLFDKDQAIKHITVTQQTNTNTTHNNGIR